METKKNGALYLGVRWPGPVLAWRVTFFAIVVVLVSFECASSDMRAQQRVTVPDLAGAHLDKRRLLLGVSMLGESIEQDIEVLRQMTGHIFEPKQTEGSLPDGGKQYRSFAPYFKASPLLKYGRYEYRIYADGRYRPAMSLDFNQEAVCYRMEDLESILGAPTRVRYAAEIPNKLTGPSPIWAAIYEYPSGAWSVFSFATAVCSSSVSYFSIKK
ncbi:MAG: hypothetical protein ACREUW_16615 [Burkholderiales bacterium]